MIHLLLTTSVVLLTLTTLPVVPSTRLLKTLLHLPVSPLTLWFFSTLCQCPARPTVDAVRLLVGSLPHERHARVELYLALHGRVDETAVCRSRMGGLVSRAAVRAVRSPAVRIVRPESDGTKMHNFSLDYNRMVNIAPVVTGLDVTRNTLKLQRPHALPRHRARHRNPAVFVSTAGGRLAVPLQLLSRTSRMCVRRVSANWEGRHHTRHDTGWRRPDDSGRAVRSSQTLTRTVQWRRTDGEGEGGEREE